MAAYPAVNTADLKQFVNTTDGVDTKLFQTHIEGSILYCQGALAKWVALQPGQRLPADKHAAYKQAVLWGALSDVSIASPGSVPALLNAEVVEWSDFQAQCKAKRADLLGLISGHHPIAKTVAKPKAVQKPLAWLFTLVLLWIPLYAEGNSRYDTHFKRATRLYMSTSVPWRWLKAQGMQESGLRVHVCSPVGACGLMQFMPATAKDFQLNPFDARGSIYAAADYMARLRKQWSAPRPAWDKHALALGSYNWGLGNMLRVQRRTGAQKWQQFKAHLPEETAEYAPRIRNWCKRFNRSMPCLIR